MPELGRAALLVTLGLSTYALVAGAYAAHVGRRRLARSAQNALVAAFLSTAVAAAVLVFALLRNDFSFEYVARTRSRELFTLTVLVSALGIAVGSAKFFGASMALGAFLAGLIVGQSEFSARAAADALPMRDAFAVLFFVSVGMLVNPLTLLANAGQVLALTALIVIGKPVFTLLMGLVLPASGRTMLVVSAGLLYATPAVVPAVLGYLILQTAYGLLLRQVPVLDLFAIATGFVFRVVAGSAAIDVKTSSWMFIATASLALYLASSKRLTEMRSTGGGALPDKP